MKQGDMIGGRYRLERLLGEGGMGAVWAATHTVTGKSVAVKFLKGGLSTNSGVVERFLREARAACAVRHPNVVQIHDVLTLDSGAPAMVMDLLDGESLGAKLAREGRLSVLEFAQIMSPVLSAVAAAHAASIVHRDLKPDNLFLARTIDGSVDVKVLDFGIAKITTPEQEGGQLTKTGSMLGTPFYMSPEQLFGEKDIDARSDVWALGIIFYECLSGVLPTYAENLGQIIKTVTTTGFTPLALVAPHVPADISDVVQRMLSRERASRPPNLHEVRAVLAPYLGHPSQAPAGTRLSESARTAATAPTEAELSPTADVNALLAGLARPSTSAPVERKVGDVQKTGDVQWESTQRPVPDKRSAALPSLIVGGVLVLAVVGAVGGSRLWHRTAVQPPASSGAPLPEKNGSTLPVPALPEESAPGPSSSPVDVAARSIAPATSGAPSVMVSARRPVASASAKPLPVSPVRTGRTEPGTLEEKVPF